jgi:hypothetical protein
MEEMFSEKALQLVDALLSGDLLDNTILMDARAHGWFDDYRLVFGRYNKVEGSMARFFASNRAAVSSSHSSQGSLAGSRPARDKFGSGGTREG